MMLAQAENRTTSRTLTASLAALLMAAFFISAASLALPGQAQAQEVRERRSIMEMIFRNDRRKVVRPEKSVVPVKKPRRKKSIAASDPAVTGAEIQIAKNPDARKVLVVGDFMASALADGLEAAFASDPGISIEKRTDGSSGLVRTDHLDWPQTLTAAIGEIKPAMLVVMLGANDRQQMVVGASKEKFQTEAWKVEYDRRVAAITEIARTNKVPFIWTGLPAFSSPSLSADAATLNNFYRAKAETGGGTFIDVWDGFADENGKFVASGSDINGQPVRLRGSDGISLTKAGKRKLAFYVEGQIRKLIGTDGLPATASLLPGTTDPASTAPVLTNILTVPPISLMDPELDGGAALLDTASVPKPSGLTPRDKLIEKGETVDAPEGRIDDFRWKPAVEPAG